MRRITFKLICAKCGYLNPIAPDKYRCHIKGSCPAFNDEDDKAWVLRMLLEDCKHSKDGVPEDLTSKGGLL